MPFSQSTQLSAIVGYFEARRPRSILDIGVGMGQYGFLLRTNLENVNLFDIRGQQASQRDRSGWLFRIDGIEGYAGYLTPVHDYAYDQLMIGDALAQLDSLPSGAYEAVLAVDILEHFDHDDGERFLRECRRVASRFALVSTPKAFEAQTVEANPLEDHRSHWTAEELAAAGFSQVLPNELSWIAVHTRG